jgi:hypothetical protein
MTYTIRTLFTALRYPVEKRLNLRLNFEPIRGYRRIKLLIGNYVYKIFQFLVSFLSYLVSSKFQIAFREILLKKLKLKEPIEIDKNKKIK